MRVTAYATTADSGRVRLHCKPLLGEAYDLYATRVAFMHGYEWRLTSGRAPTTKMLDAIDRLCLGTAK